MNCNFERRFRYCRVVDLKLPTLSQDNIVRVQTGVFLAEKKLYSRHFTTRSGLYILLSNFAESGQPNLELVLVVESKGDY